MRHFKRSEFKMGKELVFFKMNVDFLYLLDDLRELVNEPLYLNSSYRSIEYNEKVQKAANKKYKPYSSKSKHMEGVAVDLKCNNGALRLKIVENALALGLTVGVAKSFVHIDNRASQIVFAY